MKNFVRALREALCYWRTLVCATLCSLVVAALWGGNIGALFPIIQVTLGEESLQHWVAARIAASEQSIDDLSQRIGVAHDALATAAPHELTPLQARIAQLESERATLEASLRSSRRLQPWVGRLLPEDPFLTVVVVITVLMVSTVIKHVFMLLNTMLIANVSNRIARRTRLRVFERAMHMDRAGFAKYGTSGFTTQITATTDMLANGIMEVYGGAIREPLKIIACLAGACYISWRLLVLSLIIAPLVTYLIVWLSKRIKSVSRRALEQARSFQHVMLEAFGSIQTVQAYGMERTEQQRFERTTLDLLRLSLKSAFYNALTRPVTELLGIGMVGTTVIVGAYLVLNHETHLLGVRITDTPLSVSTMMVFFGLLVGASDPVRKLSTVFTGVNSGIAAADLLYPLLDREPLIRSPRHPRMIARPHRRLELRDVTFAYPGHDSVLSGINLDIPFGSKVALIGVNGSGKTSLIHLICRFYDPQQGSVLLDGIDLRELALDDVRNRIGLVTQQTELFNDTILYNIRYGSLNATDEQVRRAAAMAHAHEFIMTFPERYDTRVGQSGQRLSGGQRQRIALARAILRDPEILILDEATSQIDLESERLIHQVLTEFSRNRTLILITHRLASLGLADRIYELDAGRMLPRDVRPKLSA
ncbi:MAG: ABC transporter ATP-binding protein/permease [Pirellulaceae bacterium]|jgi:ATP-binding cassette subfamily B protein/subfamily B ATP-binding cassette protein MsbA|nr:ABC transporter ATP-binding protein/permease [Pirellulaceae bacterium]